MAKVIHTILNLKDNMSKGLLDAAKNTQGVSKEMKDATREVIAFKNKAGNAIKGFASTAAKAFAGTVTAATGAFFAMGSLTEEYRAEQGKLNSAFETAGYSAEVAAEAYKDFFKITGDSGTATEASQLLAELTQNTQDIATWVDIAAGAYSKWGTAMDTAGLIESINETQKAGTVTGSLADMLVWGFDSAEKFGVALKEATEANEEWNEAVKAAQTTEDFFNLALQECANEAERNKLIMDTLSGAYGDAANAFYENNDALLQARDRQAMIAEVTGKLGEASANAQNQVWALAGAQEDGSIRAGSALDFVITKADEFTNWVNSLDLSTLQTEFDAKFAVAVEKGADAVDACVDAFNWLRENSDAVITTLKILGGVFVGSKILTFTADTASAISTLYNFNKTIFTVAKDRIPKLAESLKKTDWNFADRIHNSAMSGLNKTSAAFSKFGNSAANVGKKVATGVSSGVKKAGVAIGKFGKSAVSVGKNVATGVGSGITKAGGAISKFGKAALSGGKTVAKGLGSGIVKAGTTVGQFSKSAVSSAGKGLATFGKSAVSAGKTMATGLGSGIAGAAGKLASFGKLALGFVSANPIVLLIAGAIAAGVLLWQNWDKVKAFAIGLWEKVKEVFGGIKDSISGAVEIVKEKVSGAFNGVKDSIIGAFESVKEKLSGFFSWIDEKLESIPILGDMYKNTKLVGGWLFDKIGGNAMGTNYWTGGLTAVHERGGEIINLPSGTQIIPHDISLNMAEKFGSKVVNSNIAPVNLKKSSATAPNITVHITVQGNMIGNKEYAKQLGEEVAGEIMKKMENIA